MVYQKSRSNGKLVPCSYSCTPLPHTLMQHQERAGQINPQPESSQSSLWHTSQLPLSIVAFCFSGCFYLTVCTSLQKASPGKFAGAPGNEGDVDGSAVDQKLWLVGKGELMQTMQRQRISLPPVIYVFYLLSKTTKGETSIQDIQIFSKQV